MAKKGSTVSVVWELAEPIAQQLGFTLWDVRFEKEGGSWFLGREMRRPEHFAACMGMPVELRSIRPIDGVRDFKGTLSSYEDGQVTVDCDGTPRSFPVKELGFIRLDDFDEADFEQE